MRYVSAGGACGDRLPADSESPVNQRGSVISDGYEVVFFCLDGLKFVWCYRGGVRKMNVLVGIPFLIVNFLIMY